jgi:hypothetical protein
MPNEAILEFMRRLLAGTKNGSVKWEKTAQKSERFKAKSGSGSIILYEELVEEDTWATVLEIRDQNAQVLETVATDPLRPGAWRNWEETLHSLHEEARLSALGTAKTLETLADEWKLPPDPESDDIPF